MAKITRMGSNAILSNSVEYHNFVFLAGMTADDLSQDVSGQTRQVLAKIDAALEANGTDKGEGGRAALFGGPRRDQEVLAVAGRPVRACVEANMADPRHLVEIMVNACK